MLSSAVFSDQSEIAALLYLISIVSSFFCVEENSDRFFCFVYDLCSDQQVLLTQKLKRLNLQKSVPSGEESPKKVNEILNKTCTEKSDLEFFLRLNNSTERC